MEIPALFYVCLIAVVAFMGIIFLFINVKRYNEDFFRAEKMLLFSLPISVALGRIGYVCLNFEEFRSNLSTVFVFWQGGISPTVAFISFFAFVFCYSEVHALKAFLWFDIFIIPMIFVIALHEIGLYAIFPIVGEMFPGMERLFVITPIGFTEREFLQVTALAEGVATFILAVLLIKVKNSVSGLVFTLGLSFFCSIRFAAMFFYVVSVPIVFNAEHISFGLVAVVFTALSVFIIRTSRNY
ncbi:MAG: prolipoprotein diacylglyceryl transferase [Selenomonadaceae bacterium]|nr:prolipoprotein diacylglyceryl transferase [Selenomonadaceae bacterium]